MDNNYENITDFTESIPITFSPYRVVNVLVARDSVYVRSTRVMTMFF